VKTLGFAVLAVIFTLPWAQAEIEKPKPDFADVSYGPHERNVLDFWKAKSDAPAPLVVFIHGGGFLGGDKTMVEPALLDECLKSGISVASIRYRFSTDARFPAPMMDGAKAIQFLRSKAGEWNLNKRVAASGSSAGAGMSLWIGYHDDLANPASSDPIARESTRLSCMAVYGAQCSYDPRFIKKLIGGRAHEHQALPKLYGLAPEEMDTAKAYELFELASPINYVTADDPPVFMYYSEPNEPLPADAKPGQGIHHPKFGVALKEKLDPLHIECVIRNREDYGSAEKPLDLVSREMAQFCKRIFSASSTN
jgi:acetyl esterase/lipase